MPVSCPRTIRPLRSRMVTPSAFRLLIFNIVLSFRGLNESQFLLLFINTDGAVDKIDEDRYRKTWLRVSSALPRVGPTRIGCQLGIRETAEEFQKVFSVLPREGDPLHAGIFLRIVVSAASRGI